MNPEEICSKYNTDIIVRRWAATWIDFVVLALFFLVPDLLLGNDLYQKTIFIWIGLALAYFPVLETCYGKSVGKWLTNTVVVNQHGAIPSFGQSLIRTLFRVFEVNPLLLGGLPAGIAALLTSSKQPLGDVVANTYVILSKDYFQLQNQQTPDVI